MKKLISLLLVLTLVIGLLPVAAFAEDSGGKDFWDGYELLYDGEPWKVYALEETTDTLTLDELNITLRDPSGSEVPKDAYRLVIGYEGDWDEENSCPLVDPFYGPYGLPDDDSGGEGMGFYAAYAVADENSGYSGHTHTQSFMTFHKYSFNYIGCNATFGDRYERPCTWSWHNYFEIPSSVAKEPVVRDITLSPVDPEHYTITFFKRGTGIPPAAGMDYLNKVYPEDKPLAGMPTAPGSYFARIDGKDPYYGTGYVDFDITGSSSADFSEGYELKFSGEEWGDYYLDGKEDTLTVDDLNITLVRGGNEIVPEDAYELRFFIEKGWDDETDSPIYEDIEEPFGLSALPEAMERGWLMHSVCAVAKDGSGYTGQTPEFEFMIKDKYTLDRNSGMIDFGEKYLSRSFRSWHYFYVIPASEMHEPVVTDLLGNELSPDNYTLTYFERNDAALDGDDPDRDMLYPEDKPLSGMPTEAGQYFVRLDGKEPYYGTNYADFDIVDFYAQPYGSTARYYDGYTLYMDKDETVKLRFIMEPYDDEMMPGWISDDLNDAGFHLAFEPEIIDGEAYAVIDTNGMTEPAEGTLTFNWYKLSELIDKHGMHWDTAPVYYSSTIKISMTPDAVLLGDADGSGEVDAVDATIVQRKVIGLETPYDNEVLARGDIDGDGALTIVDATFIQRYSVHVKTPYTIGSEIIDNWLWPTPGYYSLNYSFDSPYSFREGGTFGAVGIQANTGQPVYSAQSGIVTAVYNECPHSFSGAMCDCGDGYGNYVWIRHSDSIETIYAHLVSATVSVGDKVTAGQVIGYTGSSGDTNTPMLRFETRKNGVCFDPMELWDQV